MNATVVQVMVMRAQVPRPEPKAGGGIAAITRVVPVGAVEEMLIMAVIVVVLATGTF